PPLPTSPPAPARPSLAPPRVRVARPRADTRMIRHLTRWRQVGNGTKEAFHDGRRLDRAAGPGRPGPDGPRGGGGRPAAGRAAGAAPRDGRGRLEQRPADLLGAARRGAAEELRRRAGRPPRPGRPRLPPPPPVPDQRHPLRDR